MQRGSVDPGDHARARARDRAVGGEGAAARPARGAAADAPARGTLNARHPPGQADDGRLPPSRRRLLLGVWAALCAVLLVRAFADGVLRAARGPLPPAAEPIAIDVNRATVGELMALPGIGRSRAESIVLHRVRHGPFASVGDLVGVDGIGLETVAALREHACAGSGR